MCAREATPSFSDDLMKGDGVCPVKRGRGDNVPHLCPPPLPCPQKSGALNHTGNAFIASSYPLLTSVAPSVPG